METMGSTPSPPLDFDFYDHLHSNISVALSTIATTKNATNISKLNKRGELIMSVYIKYLV